jgi:radical SAM protein with 4Fe4S-binding SPASM domain
MAPTTAFPSKLSASAIRPLVLQWHITERCNYRCSHCYQEGYDGRDEMSFDEMLAVVDQFTELLASENVRTSPLRTRGDVRITGGEPFVREDCWKLLEILASRKDLLSFAILCNGSLIDAVAARRLRELNVAFVQVSIEGSQKTNDQIRGPGALDRAVSALEHLRREGIYSAIAFTAHRQNYHEFPAVAELARRLQANRVWADRLVPYGSGAELKEMMLTPKETREFFEIMFEARAEAGRSFGRTEISLGRALQFLVGGDQPYRCAAGDTLVALQPNGDLYPCRRMPIRVGNLRKERLTDLYYKNEMMLALRDRSCAARGCEQCRFERECHGGLRCLSYALTRDPFTADPGCWHAHVAREPGAITSAERMIR